MTMRFASGSALLACALSLPCSAADDIFANTPIAQREIRTANRVNAAPGDRFRLGVIVARPNPFRGNNGSVGTTVIPYRPNSSQPDAPLPFLFSPASPDEFSTGRYPFSDDLVDSWTLVISNPESPNSPVTLHTPPVRRADGTIPPPLPFVHDMSISGTETNVTFHWTVPAGAIFDRASIRIMDRDRPTPTANATLLYIANVPATATSHTPPAVLNASGDTLHVGGQYTAVIQLQELLPGGAVNRSSSYFDFSPMGPGAPATVYLPVVDGSTNVYSFHIDNVTQRIYIDPDVAVAYEYATGPGDPNFESVILPNIGDGMFGLQLFDGASWHEGPPLSAGMPYFFGGNGVARFRVTGIEASAGLDPGNPSAFVTGLTFVSPGRFTGTMTPLTRTPDITPPVVTASISGPSGNAGWYTGPVTVTWNVSDAESPITSAPCLPTTIAADTPGTTVGCTASSEGGATSASVTVRIDATPPIIDCAATPSVLWPPNGKLVDVATHVTLSDALSGTASFRLASIDSNEGAVASDATGWVLGTPDTAGQLRASRAGNGSGRNYGLTYTATDAAGNSSTCVVTVRVPHNR